MRLTCSGTRYARFNVDNGRGNYRRSMISPVFPLQSGYNFTGRSLVAQRTELCAWITAEAPYGCRIDDNDSFSSSGYSMTFTTESMLSDGSAPQQTLRISLIGYRGSFLTVLNQIRRYIAYLTRQSKKSGHGQIDIDIDRLAVGCLLQVGLYVNRLQT